MFQIFACLVSWTFAYHTGHEPHMTRKVRSQIVERQPSCTTHSGVLKQDIFTCTDAEYCCFTEGTEYVSSLVTEVVYHCTVLAMGNPGGRKAGRTCVPFSVKVGHPCRRAAEANESSNVETTGGEASSAVRRL